MALQHTVAWWEIPTLTLHVNVGIFPLSHAGFISSYTAFYHLDPYFIFKLIIFLVYCIVLNSDLGVSRAIFT